GAERLLTRVDQLPLTDVSSARFAEVDVEVRDAQGKLVPNFVRHLRFDASDLSPAGQYIGRNGTHGVPTMPLRLTAMVADADAVAFISADPVSSSTAASFDMSQHEYVPVAFDVRDVEVLAHAVDARSDQRGPIAL